MDIVIRKLGIDLLFEDYTWLLHEIVADMFSRDMNDLLSLFAVAIIADKRVFAKEIDTLVKAANKLQIAREIEPDLSEAKILIWYELNKDQLGEMVSNSNFKAWFYDCLDRVARIANKTDILDVMKDISLSDGELHVSEQALMVLTARHWNIALAA